MSIALSIMKVKYAVLLGFLIGIFNLIPYFGAIAGVVASFMKLKAFIYVTPAFLSLPMWVSKSENFVVQAIIVIIVASIATFIATWMIGFDDPVDKIPLVE